MNQKKLRVLLHHKGAMIGLGILVVFVVLAAFIGFISPYDPNTWGQDDPEQGPSWSHIMGTDNSGRDIFTRICFGARYSLMIGLACVVFSMLFGIPLGAAAGYFGGWTDMVISRFIDVMLSFPSILLAIMIAAVMKPGLNSVIIAVGVVGVPQFARQVRGSVLSIRELDFVQASRALGAGHGRILFREVLPNAFGPIIVLATLGIGTSILTAAGLSFLGLGVEADTYEWGSMLHDGYAYYRRSISLALFSGLAISLAVLGFNLFGDGLRDALDPRSRVTS